MKLNRFVVMGAVFIGVLGFCHGTADASTSMVNQYIAMHHIEPVAVSKRIWHGFPKYRYRHGFKKPEGVVVHETGNPNSNIFSEIAYMKRNYSNGFVHAFIDGTHIINIANTNYLAWGAGYPANARFLQFEQVEVHSKKQFAKQAANAAYFTAKLLKQYHLKPNDAAYDGKGTVWSHHAVSQFLGGTDHTDPDGYYKTAGRRYFGQAYSMAQLYQLIKQDYGKLN
ncbi:N-acetylmuramoyl-L-alanine amidase [Secundilactobacillus kimchicus]|uniref:N-acetylmuramoyl-L-alanine amidase family 2 protein n=1 Tax=Secundilactobacillus kimchicus JCM 15530 TaxID=1302272 RepID=A0A0R1HZU8_9LACO|nr:N-acetylmuramoyl-L-alanine amidase [Secundilactobacillus kimchicus]KRK48519.1 N-acetylmuramoyl-L-alanine amidase family 2 protein [Secundilactobacillus kimchicus JCM 15530]MBT9671266.1 N-acetylmuramoyl-L-alanine amidase [Secundilactobacillus kimchicus]